MFPELNDIITYILKYKSWFISLNNLIFQLTKLYENNKDIINLIKINYKYINTNKYIKFKDIDKNLEDLNKTDLNWIYRITQIFYILNLLDNNKSELYDIQPNILKTKWELK